MRADHAIGFRELIGGNAKLLARDPAGPQTHFSSEQFIDELAAATNSDPIEFRLRYLTDPRDIAVMKAVAEKAGWKPRPAPRNDQAGADVVSGRGVAIGSHSETTVALVAEITVDRSTGRITPIRYIVAHDCGLIINPQLLLRTIEGNCIQGASRVCVPKTSSGNDFGFRGKNSLFFRINSLIASR